MALTPILLSDAVSTLVTKTNAIITDVGNKDNLTTTAKSDLVVAINEINATLATIDTPEEIALQVETYFNTAGRTYDVTGFHADSADIDSATITTLTGDSATFEHLRVNQTLVSHGISTFTGKSTIDSAEITTLKMDGAGGLQHLKPLQIKNSAGTVVLAGYLLSTSNTDGTL